MPDLSASTKRTPKWKRRPESRPDEILSAAIEVFGEAGLARAKLDDVAKKAGVSKGTLYLYFDSKEELFRCVVQQRIASCFGAAERRLREFQGSSREMLEWFLRRSWETIRRPEMVQIARMVNSELANFPDLTRFYFDEVILRNRALLNQVLDRGLASGEFRAVPHDFVIRAVPSLLLHGAIYQRGFGRFDPHALTDEQVIEGIVDLVLHGVMARKES